MKEDRRSHVRKPVAVQLDLISESTRRFVGRGFITNLCEGGAALETPKILRPGDTVAVSFTLPDTACLDIAAEIVYCREGILSKAYGVRFRQAEADAVRLIGEYLCHRPAD